MRRTRLSVEFIVGLLAQGWSIEEVLEEYQLARQDVLACLAYAHDMLAEEEVYPIPS